MSWGYRIVLAFVLFAGFTFYLVYQSFNQRVDLVSDNYYEQELKYQERIDNSNNAKSLKEEVTVAVDDKNIIIQFPQELSGSITGNIHFFRPSDSRLDYKIVIITDSLGKQIVDKKNLSKGHYKVMMEWSNGGQKYYSEKTINNQ